MTLRATASSVQSSVNRLANGSATPAANSILTAFTIAHGLPSTPTFYQITPRNLLSAALYYVTSDATNLTITYVAAPLTGALSFGWIAGV